MSSTWPRTLSVGLVLAAAWLPLGHRAPVGGDVAGDEIRGQIIDVDRLGEQRSLKIFDPLRQLTEHVALEPSYFRVGIVCGLYAREKSVERRTGVRKHRLTIPRFPCSRKAQSSSGRAGLCASFGQDALQEL